jgi:hypothetical protein
MRTAPSYACAAHRLHRHCRLHHVTNEPPRGVITIDPTWWTAMGICAIAAGVLAMAVQLRPVWSGRDKAP